MTAGVDMDLESTFAGGCCCCCRREHIKLHVIFNVRGTGQKEVGGWRDNEPWRSFYFLSSLQEQNLLRLENMDSYKSCQSCHHISRWQLWILRSLQNATSCAATHVGNAKASISHLFQVQNAMYPVTLPPFLYGAPMLPGAPDWWCYWETEGDSCKNTMASRRSRSTTCKTAAICWCNDQRYEASL